MGKKTKEKQLDSILDGERNIELIDGRVMTLRPFTFGSLTLAQKLGLSMFTGEEDEEIDEEIEGLSDDIINQLKIFFWMQSEPIREVLDAVHDGTWERKVDEFSMYIPVHKMGELMEEVNRISRMTAETAVDVLPKDDPDSDEPGE